MRPGMVFWHRADKETARFMDSALFHAVLSHQTTKLTVAQPVASVILNA